jgi:hypothetical protein
VDLTLVEVKRQVLSFSEMPRLFLCWGFGIVLYSSYAKIQNAVKVKVKSASVTFG